MRCPQSCEASPGRVNILFIRLLTLVVLVFLPGTRAGATDASLELSLGYNDNITLSPTPVGSGFTQYRIRFAHQFFSDIPEIDLEGFGSAGYRDYFRASDNYRLSGGASLTFPLKGGRFLPGLLYKTTLYRDGEQPEDEINAHKLEGRLEWLATARLTLSVWQSWEWQDYWNPVELGMVSGFRERAGGEGHMNGPGHQNREGRSVSRDDRLSSAGLQATFHFRPDLNAAGAFAWNRLSSNVTKESYDEADLSGSLTWTPGDVWELSAGTGWREADYDHATGRGARLDRAWRFGIGISRFISKYELFFRLDWQDNDSSLPEESYEGTVTQCGIARSF